MEDKKINLLVVGASGMVGEYLFNFFSKKPEFNVCGTYFSQHGADDRLVLLDARDREAVKKMFDEFQPEIVVAPAAIPNVERCEEEPKETGEVNVGGIRNLVDLIEGTNIKLVYFSSDYVFDGKNSPYAEDDATNPLNEYGRQKLEMEKEIQARLKDFLIVRVTGVYGWHRRGRNFVLQILDKLKNGSEMRAPSDQFNNPTYAGDVCEAIYKLLKQKRSGIFHIVGSERLNRVVFAKNVAKVFGLPEKGIVPTPTDELGLKAKRPLDSSLKTDKLNACGIFMSNTLDGLKKMKEDTSSGR